MTPQQQQNWDSIERHYRFTIPVWFITFVVSTAFAVYIGPGWHAMGIAFIAGFQLSCGLACIQHRNNAQLMRVTLVGFESTIDQWEKLHEAGNRTPMQPS